MRTPLPPRTPEPPPPATPPEPGLPDVATLLRRGFAHWQVVIVTLLLGAAVTGQVIRARTPGFKSETVIVYHEGIGRGVGGAVASPDAVRALGSRLKETLLAQQTLRRLVEEHHLYPDVVARTGHADAVEQMRKKTDFKARGADTFAISFEGTTPAEAQAVCAHMAELLIADDARRTREEDRSTDAFLDLEKQRADEDLARAERDYAELLAAHPELAAANATFGVEARARRRDAETAAKKRRPRPAPASGRRRLPPSAVAAAPGVASDPILVAARAAAQAEAIVAQRDLDQKRVVFTEQHPDVRAARARLEAAASALARADETLRAASPPAALLPATGVAEDPYADPRLGAAEPRPAASTSGAPPAADDGTGVDLELTWMEKQRALGAAQRHQAEIAARLDHTRLIRATDEQGKGAGLIVLDPAFRPGGATTAPDRTVAVLGLVASLTLGLLLAMTWGLFLDDRVFTPAEVEGIVGVPVIGAIPEPHLRRAARVR